MFDEVTRIGRTLERLAAGGVLDDTELVLVDDGSTDGTFTVAADHAHRLGLRRVQFVRFPENRGKGAAVRAGMLAARGESRVFVDADLSVALDDVERCFRALEAGADVAYGTRAHPSSSLQRSQPAYRVASGRTFNLLLRILRLTSDRDTQCGLKGFRAAAAQEVFGTLRTNRFAFDVEALARADRAGYSIVAVPVTWSHVEASRVRAVRDGIDMAIAAMRIRVALDREARHAIDSHTVAPVTSIASTTDGAVATETAMAIPTDVAPQTDMAVDAYDAMAKVERTHWWFRAKHDLVVDLLRLSGIDRGRVVDVGCGTGGHLERLRAAGYDVVGAELEPRALSFAAGLDPRPSLVRSTAEALPFASGSALAVTALDVIEHLDDDVAAFREFRRVVAPGGLIVVTAPAYRWAWSEHDERLGHRRRYVRAELHAAAQAAGLTVLRCSHFHSWLTPLAFAVRRTPAKRLLRGSPEEASFVHPTVNRALRAVTNVERRVLLRRSVPAGLSVVLVARNDDAEVGPESRSAAAA